MMLRKFTIMMLIMPLASAKFILIHTHHVDHFFNQVSHTVTHTVTHVARPVEKPIKMPVKVIRPIEKETAVIDKAVPDQQIDKTIKQVVNVPKAIDQKSIEKISSDVEKTSKDAEKAIAQVPDDVSKGINTISTGYTDAIQNPANAAKIFMTKDGGDDLVTHAGNDDRENPNAGTQTVQWGDSEKGKKEMEHAVSTTLQCGESFIPIYGTVQTLSQIGQYNNTEVCAALGATNDLDGPASESAAAILETLSE